MKDNRNSWKINNNLLLKTIFASKGYLKGLRPPRSVFNGVEVAAYKYATPAAVCISADFELGWAWRHLTPAERICKGQSARTNFPYLLALLEDYGIPVTWATVGHLFLERCNGSSNGLAHPAMPRPLKNTQCDGDWYGCDPCTDVHRDPCWYAPDLIQSLIDSRVPHEIASHSFSHIDFSTACSDDTLVTREIEECIRVMKPYGLQPKSLVYPFNIMGHSYLDVLYNLGIIAVRHRDTGKMRLSYPEHTSSGVYKIYESMHLWPPQYYHFMDKARIFLREACKHNAVYHLWFHPSDPFDFFRNEFKWIVEYIAELREKGLVWMGTMAELAAYCEARRTTSLDVHRSDQEVRIEIRSALDREKYGCPEITLLVPCHHAPRKAVVRFPHETRESGTGDLLMNERKQLVINVPVSARSLTLTF